MITHLNPGLAKWNLATGEKLAGFGGGVSPLAADSEFLDLESMLVGECAKGRNEFREYQEVHRSNRLYSTGREVSRKALCAEYQPALCDRGDETLLNKVC